MWNEPTPEQLARIPRLYETESTPLKDKPIHLHCFIGGCDWSGERICTQLHEK